MKKLALALVCLVSIAFFASCTPEGQPVISVLTEDGYVQDGAVIEFNDTVNFGFLMTSSIETSKELSKLVVKIDDEEWESVDLTGSEYTYRSSVIFEPTRDSIYAATITATVTDVAGEEATVTINLSIKDAPKPMAETAIEWTKVGHTVADLSAYGLVWKEENYKSPFTHILPAENCMLFACAGKGADFTTITTEVELAAYFQKLQEMEVLPAEINKDEYNKVDCNASATYNDLLITKDATGAFHAILIEKADVTTPAAGTQIVITGKAK